MTSHRDHKKRLRATGLTDPEFAMVGLLEEILERFRWLQVLGYACNFVLSDKLKLPEAERDQVLKAAAAAVEKDGTLKGWHERLARLKQDLVSSRREMERELRNEHGSRREREAGA